MHDRVGGPTRIGTAAELSRDSILATALDYPDGLAGAPLATSLGAPLLLTGPEELSDQARREILRTGATQAVLLGGMAALGEGLEAALEQMGVTARRVAGDDRFGTAAAIAAELGDSTTAYLVEGINADPARGWPDAVSEEVAAAVAAAGPKVTRVAGPDRYATSAALAGQDASARVVVAATGGDWPDALTAGSAAAAWDAMLVLVDGADLDASAATRDLVEGRAFDRLVIAGWEAAIATDVADALAAAADRGAPPAG